MLQIIVGAALMLIGIIVGVVLGSGLANKDRVKE